ncbi:DUF4962 domain-containing protein [Paenibacillus oceani]|uniref:DUF4962 domain-containing protein n=1 Tax=Paenibacillus oceani TaxID=2772510 RepID=A0A927C9M6_9BACL|nr:DUF4962 domain-containing protein [Paenibacillus oceani]MBD2862658.1 DUF4962 domain-containing protein [Paenibacillus oceani]
MTKLYEPNSDILTVPYEPNERTILLENPPRFTWMPAAESDDRYVLQLSSSPGFEAERTDVYEPVPYNYFTPDRPLAPGICYWRYALLIGEETADGCAAGIGAAANTGAGQRTEWSRVRSFEVPAGLPETPLPGRGTRYPAPGGGHPRLWLQADSLAPFRDAVRKDASAYGWGEFMEKSVLPWTNRPLIPEPAPYPDNKRVAHLWRRMYIDCQECLYAVRHLSVAGIVLEDRERIGQAKRWLLHVASWNTEGATSRDYNDEAAFRIAGALAWGYDWLHGELNEAERAAVRRSLFRRTEQVACHVIERSKIHQVPYDSHAVRSLSSVLVPCCMALLGEEPKAEQWLDYAIEYFACLYSPWGGADGGWAEGPMYWTTGMAFVTEAMNLLRSYTGIDLYRRPFFRRTGDFPLYVFPPDVRRASFADQSTLGDPPSLKTGFNVRQFAGVTGDGRYQWYYEQVKRLNPDADSKFYNYGWWDFRFDEMTYLHDYPPVESVAPVGIEAVKWFKDVGWVAMHRRMDDPQEHIMLLTKSSRYGSISHSHGDQNAFLLHAFGEPLAIESGYYVAFGSTMHLQWRRQTRSKNVILIDGQGQYAGPDKVLNMAASGTVLEVCDTGDCSFVRSDATAAYRQLVPDLKSYVREIYFVGQSYFVIVDYVDLEQPASVDWLFHTLHPMTIKGQSFRVNGEKAELAGRFAYCSSGELELSQHNEFTDVDPSEIEGLPLHWHLTASTRKASSHRIAALLVPIKKGDAKYVSFFMDDQDHGVHLYFTEDGRTQRIEIAKSY